MKLVEAVGKRVEELLQERNMKANHLAKLGGIPRSTLSVLIAAKRKAVQLDTVYQICATLDIPLQEFFNSPIFNEVTD
ncbi:MAG: helix-turn-helix transcriptional regulator [Clostridia bacterium]|nr:helix-turn-helix transcriptional regulator [Clostridia bacterium]MBR2903433.1 helix-turn-helix transcriptional regulator [Clostridia bacterium]